MLMVYYFLSFFLGTFAASGKGFFLQSFPISAMRNTETRHSLSDCAFWVTARITWKLKLYTWVPISVSYKMMYATHSLSDLRWLTLLSFAVSYSSISWFHVLNLMSTWYDQMITLPIVVLNVHFFVGYRYIRSVSSPQVYTKNNHWFDETGYQISHDTFLI